MTAPGPVRWLYFQYGGRLPDRYRDWVPHNGTCRTWMARVVVRGLVQVFPILAALFVGLGVLGGSWPLAAGSVLLGFLVSCASSSPTPWKASITVSPSTVSPGPRHRGPAPQARGGERRYRETWRGR